MRTKLKGEVVALKNIKTVTVRVTTLKIHPKYSKPIKKKKNFQVHYENISLELGDKVIIMNCRPYSATKRFLVYKKV